MPSRTALLVLAVLATLVSATALSLSRDPGSAVAQSTGQNASDVVFARQMTPHHEGGVKLGRLAVDKGRDARVKRLGAGIVRIQKRELGTLKSLLSRFGARKLTFAPIMRRDAIDMARLERLSGAAFDAAWLDVISAHHAAAIQMAAMERSGGRLSRARSLSSAIVSVQSSELRQFNTIVSENG